MREISLSVTPGVRPPRAWLYLIPVVAVLICLGSLGISSIANAAPGDPVCEITPRPPVGVPAPFDGVCEYLSGREGVKQAAIFDNRTDQTYLLSTGDAIQYTASIAKVDVLAKWLNGYQRRGVKIPDGIPYSIRYLMGRMIQNSDNAATTGLFHFGGGCEALTKFNRLIPMNDTKVGCESSSYYGWGNTQTTAADQLRLMKVYAYGATRTVLPGATRKSLRKCKRLKKQAKRRACVRRVSRKADRMARRPILNQAAREYGLGLMRNVEPDQRFGITCGPWGTTCDPPNWATPDPEVTVSLKNGWKTLPTCTDPIPQCPWQVNSTGWVTGRGRDYALSVLTTGNPVGTGDTYGFSYGIETIQGISKLVWSNLG
ncbi:MAG TPA: serine hydrolase [Solirubrobacterales bacterium]|nr:serine hydrolase [Solirubrobacterales bacterium]